MLATIGKGVLHIKTEDLREYLTNYQEEKKSSKVTIDNIRRILSSFFTWLEDEDYILKSPVRRIHKVKAATVVKETYSDEEIEVMRDGCDNPRDLALIDMLASTGMRVGELVLLNAITLFLPEINVQRKIVEYLYMLDKKITVNQLINRNESRYI